MNRSSLRLILSGPQWQYQALLSLLSLPWGLSVPLCGALDPIIAYWGLHSLSQGRCPSLHSPDHPWTKPTCQSMPGPGVSASPSRGSVGQLGLPPVTLLPFWLGQGTGPSAQPENSPGLPLPTRGTASSHLYVKEYTQETNLYVSEKEFF